MSNGKVMLMYFHFYCVSFLCVQKLSLRLLKIYEGMLANLSVGNGGIFPLDLKD